MNSNDHVYTIYRIVVTSKREFDQQITESNDRWAFAGQLETSMALRIAPFAVQQRFYHFFCWSPLKAIQL